MVIDKNTR